MQLDKKLERFQFAYFTTTGRATGKPHRIEIWFVIEDGALWAISGPGRASDWVKNISHDPQLVLEIGDQSWDAKATLEDDLDAHPSRSRLVDRYQSSYMESLTEWSVTGLIVRVEVVGEL